MTSTIWQSIRMVFIDITSSHIDTPILRNTLAKSQNAKIFKINIPQLLIILDEKNHDEKVTKLKIQAYWWCWLTNWLPQHFLLFLNRKHIRFFDLFSKLDFVAWSVTSSLAIFIHQNWTLMKILNDVEVAIHVPITCCPCLVEEAFQWLLLKIGL